MLAMFIWYLALIYYEAVSRYIPGLLSGRKREFWQTLKTGNIGICFVNLTIITLTRNICKIKIKITT